MRTSLNILLQYLCPQHTLSKLFGKLAECRICWLKNWMINRFIRKYHIDITVIENFNVNTYPTFNHFFIRHLKAEARPIVQGLLQIASPVDGSISQIGDIQEGKIFQAKNFSFTLTELLGNSVELAQLFQKGNFATFYLAPKDYHRVHMPLTGILKKTIFIPGNLFSVNPLTAQAVPNLFARNERLVCFFETARGPMIIIMVGALIVGSINTTWQPSGYFHKKITAQNDFANLELKRGEELGYFKLGSTVITLFGHHMIEWASNLEAGVSVLMGQGIGEVK